MTQAVCHCEVLAIQNMSNGSRFHRGLIDTLLTYLTSWPDRESGVGGLLHVVAMTDSRIAALSAMFRGLVIIFNLCIIVYEAALSRLRHHSSPIGA